MVRVADHRLGKHAWRQQKLNPIGVVLHWISVDPTHPAVISDAVADPYDPATITTFLDEFNRPGGERGRVLHKTLEPRYYGSYHLLIGRTPEAGVRMLVPFGWQAYHAGVSEWPARKRSDLNRCTEGWALAGGKGVPYTDYQYETLAELAARASWRSTDFVGHDFVARPKRRRQDPGPQFDWDRLREEIGR